MMVSVVLRVTSHVSHSVQCARLSVVVRLYTDSPRPGFTVGTHLSHVAYLPQVYVGHWASALLNAVPWALKSICRRASTVFCVSPGVEQRSALLLTSSRQVIILSSEPQDTCAQAYAR